MKRRIALALLAILVVFIAAGAYRMAWNSADVVDSRTEIEMIRGVAEHGLPYLYNGPVARFHELQARWNIRQGDRVWGAYPPLLAYVAWPFFAIANVAGVSSMIWLLLIPFVIGVYALADRLFRDPIWSVVAAYLAFFATPIPATAANVNAFMLCETLVVWMLYLTARSLESERRGKLLAFGAGLLAGLALGAHLLALPMGVGAGIVLARPDREPRPMRDHRDWRAIVDAWRPTRASMSRAAFMLAGTLLVLAPIAALNDARFHSMNPLSYGPCVWQSCAATGIDRQSAGAMLADSMPSVAWIAATIVGLWYFQRDRLGLGVTIFLSLATLLSSAALIDHTWQLVKIAWAYVVDVSPLHVKELDLPPDRVGLRFADFLVRSPLQSTPLLLLVPFVRAESAREKRLISLLATPSVLLFLVCALRANEPPAYALGFPYLYLRYTVPAVAPLVILATSSLRSLAWKRGHAYLIVVAAIGMTLACHGRPDTALWRRLVLLYGTLFVAILAAWLLHRARRFGDRRRIEHATHAIAAAIALGVACTIGVTNPAMSGGRDLNDARLAGVAKDLPDRFAIVGFSPEIDIPLSLRGSRDVEYMDLYEVDPQNGWKHFRSMIDIWTGEGRPVYALWPKKIEIPSPWPEIEFREIDSKEKVFLVEKR